MRAALTIRAALAEQKRMQDAGLTGAPARLLGGHGPLVFTAIDGGPLNGSVVTHRFQRLLARAGIERMTIHALRHAYVSKMFERGVPLEVISRLVRHANATVTRAVYLHVRPETRVATSGMLDDLFGLDPALRETGS